MKKSIWQEISVPLGLLILFVVAIFGVMGMTNNLKNPPKLTVDNPKEVTTNADKLIISGQADPKATLKIGKDKVSIDKNGNFSYSANLVEGEQKIQVVATKWYAQRTETLSVNRTQNIVDTAVVTVPAVAPDTKTEAVSVANVPPTTDSSLSTSGPKENILGTIGITSLLFSLYYFKKSRKNLLKVNYKPFTTS